MSRQILLDANIIISAYDRRDSDDKPLSQKQKDEVQEFLELSKSADVSFAITPLIRYEILRNAKDFSKLKSIIDEFPEFDIGKEIGNLAVDIYILHAKKLLNNDPKAKPEKRSFDICHYASAKCNELELFTLDDEFSKFDEHYNKLKENIND